MILKVSSKLDILWFCDSFIGHGFTGLCGLLALSLCWKNFRVWLPLHISSQLSGQQAVVRKTEELNSCIYTNTNLILMNWRWPILYKKTISCLNYQNAIWKIKVKANSGRCWHSFEPFPQILLLDPRVKRSTSPSPLPSRRKVKRVLLSLFFLELDKPKFLSCSSQDMASNTFTSFAALSWIYSRTLTYLCPSVPVLFPFFFNPFLYLPWQISP